MGCWAERQPRTADAGETHFCLTYYPLALRGTLGEVTTAAGLEEWEREAGDAPSW